MITFTDGPIYLGDKRIFEDATELLLDVQHRADTSVVATLYARVSGEIIHKFETAYDAATVNAETVVATDITEMVNEAAHGLEVARLEGLNPSATFTITL